jgi:hypothetical protein
VSGGILQVDEKYLAKVKCADSSGFIFGFRFIAK